MTAEQKARDMLERIGVQNAQSLNDAALSELAALIGERDRLSAVVNYIATAESSGELHPVGPADTEYAADGCTVLRHVGPWRFLHGEGDTFIEAVEDAMGIG